ncbi:MAG: AMP-binding protein, partial [Thermoplasmataceae archaeon]
MQDKIIWEPSDQIKEESNVSLLMKKFGIDAPMDLLRRSTVDQEWFWVTLENELNVSWDSPYSKVFDFSRGVEFSRWFIEGEFNISKQMLDVQIERGLGNRNAIIYEDEEGRRQSITYGMLLNAVCSLSTLLMERGVRKGDRVGILMPLIPETIVALLAILRIGAIAEPVFSGFGENAVLSRFSDASIIACITVREFRRRGKVVTYDSIIARLREVLPSLKEVLMLEADVLSRIDGNSGISEWSPSYKSSVFLPAKRTLAEDTALIMYSSGTTGRPKGTVHTHIGAFLQPSKENKYNLDLKTGDRLFWYSDIGWVMGPWAIIGALSQGATLVLMGGVPDYPTNNRFFRFIDELKITTLGVSPTLIRSLRGHDESAPDRFEMDHLRIIASGGEPWDMKNYMWLFNRIGRCRAPIINLSGGTELMGCLLIPLPVLPLKPLTLQSPGLGMDVDVLDEMGNSVTGQVGHLVCRKPVPSMTKGFWNDYEAYLKTYWSSYPGIWYHADWSFKDSEGFWFLLGRSDDVIKVGAKRIGPSEIEEIVLGEEGVRETATIGVPDEAKGESIICFTVLGEGANAKAIKESSFRRIREMLGKP